MSSGMAAQHPDQFPSPSFALLLLCYKSSLARTQVEFRVEEMYRQFQQTPQSQRQDEESLTF
jgi:hypothetical protein